MSDKTGGGLDDDDHHQDHGYDALEGDA